MTKIKLLSAVSFCFILLFFIFSSVSLSQPPAPAPHLIDDQTCLMCHAEGAGALPVNTSLLSRSVHAGKTCTDCHADITETPHTVPLKKVDCAGCHAALIKPAGNNSAAVLIESAHTAALIRNGPMKTVNCGTCHGTHDITRPSNPSSKLFWQNIPTTCGTCHSEILKAFQHSIHGKAVTNGEREAPVCTDCHGEHSIIAVKLNSSSVSQAHITETCAQCHEAKRITDKFQIPNFVVNTYMESFHGLSSQRGSLTGANCASCHNTHDILPSSDPASSIHTANLAKTCGRCHAGIGQQLINGKIHSGQENILANSAANNVRYFYFILIFLVIGMMLLHNGLDLWTKARAHLARRAALPGPERMGRNERIQHLILLTSFLLLAYTGFALKFPQAWWAALFLGSADWRGIGHRIAAAIFMGLSIYHAWFMLFTAKGHWHLKALKPGSQDLAQFVQTFAYYFGLRHDKPRPQFYGYAEKMEYWALVWGSVIMAITGGCLMYKEIFLRYFPKWLLDAVTTVHYYEAILACLAILIWHWYFVIFDPEVYPMKCTWITGKSEPSDDERNLGKEPNVR
jgi:cytochrome b subunit of formate dehydrogenase